MTLGEALSQRKSLIGEIGDLRTRITTNVICPEDRTPDEDPDALWEQLKSKTDDLRLIVEKINTVNCTAKLPDGSTLTQALARRDMLTSLHRSTQDIIKAAKPSHYYGSPKKDDVRDKINISISEMQKDAASYAQQRRVLDAQIQVLNWSTEVV